MWGFCLSRRCAFASPAGGRGAQPPGGGGAEREERSERRGGEGGRSPDAGHSRAWANNASKRPLTPSKLNSSELSPTVNSNR